MPEPELNLDLFDGERFLGRGDLSYPRWKVLVEYDGDQHRTSTEQYDHDLVRIDRFLAARWRVVRVRKRQLFQEPQATLHQVSAALRAAGWQSWR